ncbi:hypothetical protein [Lentzea sp. CC55]|uniref:hypothetical protein n=1 Tax=Lentzea sp. CC55 TaxID=2884909 RepID=UPI001F39090B|nr:hypothetical protein [Lentzea sp. CC55]MCG8926144.1 hypothetical protein [Lentzea sp. CC55]
MSRRALPYRTPGDEAVKAQQWVLVVDGQGFELPDALPDWDYQTSLHLRNEVHVDLDSVYTSTGLTPDAKLSLVVVWTATGSGLRGTAQRISLSGGGTHTVELDIELSGTQLGGLLTLDTQLVLAESRETGVVAAPRRGGSVLWTDRRTLHLQGDAPQFPIAVVDFASTQLPAESAWHVQLSGEMNTATMGALLLLVNERKKQVVTAFQNAASPRPIDKVYLSAAYADIARTMVEHALADPDFNEESDYAEDSLGATLQSLLANLFPYTSVQHLRQRRDQSPNLFATEVQAAVGVFEEA